MSFPFSRPCVDNHDAAGGLLSQDKSSKHACLPFKLSNNYLRITLSKRLDPDVKVVSSVQYKLQMCMKHFLVLLRLCKCVIELDVRMRSSLCAA